MYCGKGVSHSFIPIVCVCVCVCVSHIPAECSDQCVRSFGLEKACHVLDAQLRVYKYISTNVCAFLCVCVCCVYVYGICVYGCVCMEYV